MANLNDERKFSKIDNNIHCCTVDDDGNTVVHVAAANDRLDLLKEYYLDRTYINAENFMGWTPLMQATRYGHINCVKFLIKYGDIFKKNKYGILLGLYEQSLSAFTLACAYGNIVIVELLLRYILLFNGKISETENPVSPLNFACLFNHQKVVKFLLLNGFSATHTSKSLGITPLYCAKITLNKEVMTLLKQFSFSREKKIVPSPLKIPNVEITSCSKSVTPKVSPAFIYGSPNTLKMELQIGNTDEMCLTPLEIELGLKFNNSNEQTIKIKSSIEDSLQLNCLKISSPNILNNVILSDNLKSSTFNFSSNANSNEQNSNYFSNKSSPNTQIFFPPDFTVSQRDKTNIINSNKRKTDTNFNDNTLNDISKLNHNHLQQNIYKLLRILQENNLGHLIPVFVNEEIDFDIFLTLTRNDLTEIGINLENDQEKILKIILEHKSRE